ncbi:MAG: hypothetical protein CM1200mP37_8460 [Chloroflexota bacterium]|nr:MAG: hypothetical protein CM1200mP37_8460 [Chloroflexota bacterium]
MVIILVVVLRRFRLIFVGAYGDDYLSKIDSGSVFTFRKNTDTWDYESKIMPNDSSATDLFGYSVAADGGIW